MMKYSWSLIFMGALLINSVSFAYRLEIKRDFFNGGVLSRVYSFNLYYEEDDRDEDRSLLKNYIEAEFLKSLYWFKNHSPIYKEEKIYIQLDLKSSIDWGKGTEALVVEETIKNTEKAFDYPTYKKEYYQKKLAELNSQLSSGK